jgi:hypothetical protein
MRLCVRVAIVSAALCASTFDLIVRADDIGTGTEAAAAPSGPPSADGTASVRAATPAEPETPVPAESTTLADEPAQAEEPQAAVGYAAEPPAIESSHAGVEPPSRDAADEPPVSPAHTILADVLEPLESLSSPGSGLYARPLTLLEALQRPGDPSRRLWIAQAYWKVSAGYAWVRWASEAVERLELVAPGSDPHDRAVLDVAAAAARADLAEARSQLGVSQQELVDLARLPITDPLPWPVDRPLASPYQTHFDAIFATRLATGRTRAIARTLPARHEAIEARAAAVTAADTALGMAEADHAKARRPIEAVIAAHAALVEQRREFLAAVRAYNLDIAEYAMAVADLSVPDDRFVSMLIGTPITVQPAAAAPAGTGAGMMPPGITIMGGDAPP